MSRSSTRGVRAAPVQDVVIDASTAVRWYVPEPESGVASKLLEGGWRLSAPDFMPIEATNAWWKKVRRGEMTRANAGIGRLAAARRHQLGSDD